MKKSFFSKFTKVITPNDEAEEYEELDEKHTRTETWSETEDPQGQLTVDVFETPSHLVVKTIVAGVRKEHLDIILSRDMITIKGKREIDDSVPEENYFHRELYWGSFSRTVLLPQEIDIDHAEATENQGMLTIKLPKIDKGKQTKLRVKSI